MNSAGEAPWTTGIIGRQVARLKSAEAPSAGEIVRRVVVCLQLGRQCLIRRILKGIAVVRVAALAGIVVLRISGNRDGSGRSQESRQGMAAAAIARTVNEI